MQLSRLRPSATVAAAVVALVIGLEAPAMAHQAKAVAHKISGSTIKPNTITGKQVKESTLGVVPSAKHATTATTATKATIATTATNATELDGKAASAYALSTGAFTTGTVAIPLDSTFHPVLSRGPLAWSAACTDSGLQATVELRATPSAALGFALGADSQSNVPIAMSFAANNGPISVLSGVTTGPGSGALNARSFVVEAENGGSSYHGTAIVDVGLANAGQCTAEIAGSS